MKTAGIIAEYNPFHNGHLYQVEQLRLRTGADYVIAVMSGDFVQRGEPAIYDKYTRTRMALNAGVDLVLELPAAFASGSAEDFAACGVALLDRIGVTDLLCFGSECGCLTSLCRAAELLCEEPPAFQELLKERLRQGDSFPKARAAAAAALLPDAELLSAPNNILGIEYIKALIRRRSAIEPFTILRNGSGYHDTDLPDACRFASASAIRKAILEGNTDSCRSLMPEVPVPEGSPSPAALNADDLSPLLHYRLLDLLHTGQDLTAYADVSRELADRIRRQILDFDSYSGHIAALKTRQYTYTRISRALLHILLGITHEQLDACREMQYAPYARLLGFRKKAGPLLTALKARSEIPLITKTADARNILTEEAYPMFLLDLHASHIYQSLIYEKQKVRVRNEFTQSVVIL